jgi:rRNA processing protein Gar1
MSFDLGDVLGELMKPYIAIKVVKAPRSHRVPDELKCDLRMYSEEMLGGSPKNKPKIYHDRSPINFIS